MLVVIHLFKPKQPAIQLPIALSEPLHPDPSNVTTSRSRKHHPAAFDLAFARVSLVIDFVSYTLIPLASTGFIFGLFTIIGAFGTGFGPAISNVALTLYTERGGRETGKLFGAMSVVQALWYVVLILGLCFLPSFP